MTHIKRIDEMKIRNTDVITTNTKKILNANNYIEERMKIMPISNDEFDKVGDFPHQDNGRGFDDEREFIDFGGKTTVYWAKYALEIDGKNRFYFYEVKDFNEFGWRLPTVKEVKQIFKPKTRWDSPWYNGCRIIKIKGNELRIKGEVSGGFHIWTKDADNRWEAPHAYSYGIDNSDEFYIDSFGTSSRFYVFLVKDKR